MFTHPKTPTDRLIKKVSIVESFYLPLHKPLQTAFRDLWIKHNNSSREYFYRRLARPIIEDYALMVHFLELVDGDSPYILNHYKDKFKNADGTPYPTYKAVKSYGLWT
jgi:hypothetical protein